MGSGVLGGVFCLFYTRSGLDIIYESEGVALIFGARKERTTIAFLMVSFIKVGFG